MNKKQIIGEILLVLCFFLILGFTIFFLKNYTEFFKQMGESLIGNNSLDIPSRSLWIITVAVLLFMIGIYCLKEGFISMKQTWLILIIDIFDIFPITLIFLAIFFKPFSLWFRLVLILCSLILYVILRIFREKIEMKGITPAPSEEG